jgi:general secretion pathway protein D
LLKLNQNKSGSKVPILGDIPIAGLLFRSAGHSDIQTKLYVFVRAEIIRPAEALASAHNDMKRISEQNRATFEKHEEEFQNYQYVPRSKPKPMDPTKVLEVR